MKRFYKDVAVDEVQDGFRITLDGRPIRTQLGAPQIVTSRALAEAMAEEWRQQGDQIAPKSFPFRDLADFAIDQVARDRTETVEKLVSYGETDTLCYRADPDEPLFRRQQEKWEPLVTRAEQRHGVKFERVSGIVHRPQPATTIERLREILVAKDAFTLAALQTLAALATSVTVALSALESNADAEELFAASNCEEDWQAEQWGWDYLAEEHRATRLAAFKMALTFLRLARDSQPEAESPQ